MAIDTISATEHRFREDPTAAQATPTVTAVLTDGRARLTAGSFTWEADLPAALGGTNAAPSPTAYLLGALAGCGVVFIRDTLAPQLGVRIDAISATARCSTDARGLLGMDGASPELAGLSLDVEITTPDAGERLARLVEAWEARCPIYLALLRPGAVNLSIRAA
jgi:uncharacterized OsmC-like protein